MPGRNSVVSTIRFCGRYSSVYEGETLRHAADHRHYTADSYGSLNAYSTNYAGSYGSSSNLAASYPPPQPPPPAHQRNAPTATPRRIIYYASLPDPVPQPNLYQPQHLPLPQQLPGSARVPHEYRGPPYDVNDAYSSDARYPPPPGDNPYRLPSMPSTITRCSSSSGLWLIHFPVQVHDHRRRAAGPGAGRVPVQRAALPGPPARRLPRPRRLPPAVQDQPAAAGRSAIAHAGRGTAGRLAHPVHAVRLQRNRYATPLPHPPSTMLQAGRT